MGEMILAGVIAHALYHHAMDIKHSDDNTHHVSTVERVVPPNNVVWVFETAQVQ